MYTVGLGPPGSAARLLSSGHPAARVASDAANSHLSPLRSMRRRRLGGAERSLGGGLRSAFPVWPVAISTPLPLAVPQSICRRAALGAGGHQRDGCQSILLGASCLAAAIDALVRQGFRS
jgi:hypothetical protein